MAAAALQSFRPGLIINRTSGRSQVNVLYLRKILHQDVGGDLMMLGEISDDPAVGQAVRKFLPVMEAAPESPAAKGLLAVVAAVAQLVAACAGRSKEQKKRGEEKETDSLPSKTELASQLLAFTHVKSETPPSPSASEGKAPGCVDVVSNSEGSDQRAPLEGIDHEESRPHVPVTL